MTIVEESFTDEVSDGGSIPPSSINKQTGFPVCLFMQESGGNRTRRERGPEGLAEGEGPVDLRRRRGLKGG